MKKWIIIVIGVLISLSIAYSVYYLSTFRVQSTNPSNGSTVSNGIDQITFSFSRDIQDVKLEENVIASDNIIFGISTVKNKLILQTRNLDIDKTYRISLQNIRSTNNEIIKVYNYSFTNKYKDYSAIPSGQRQKDLNEQKDFAQTNIQDIALTTLPISTDQYYIQAVVLDQPQDNKKIKLTIALLVTREQEKNTALVRQYKAAALTYLREKGIDINNYVVEYVPSSAANL